MDPSLTYSSYLALEEILGAQRPRSDEHDEMLFIVIHQVYELWFKQLLHELAHLQQCLEAGRTPLVLAGFKRVLTILKTAVAQVDILETMSPRHFNSFRGRLETASGFQSAQFREITAVLGGRGLRAAADQQRVIAAMNRRSLFDSYARFLAVRGFEVPRDVLDRDVTVAWEPSPGLQDVLLAVYAEDGDAAQVSERMVDLDEGLQEWRYRHVKMVERTIGDLPGTGGSAGVEYLRRGLFKPAFPDLWAVRSRL
jgi:tryptophan 2,3-dioxygenase